VNGVMTSSALRLLVLAVCAAAGSDTFLDSAQSLPNGLCVNGEQCAALCRSAVEGGRSASDFIALADYELGPPDIFNLPASDEKPPSVIDPGNLYSEAGAGKFSPAVASALPRIYVPNLITDEVDVIDPATFAVIDHFSAGGGSPQHIVPSWDLKTLWVTGDVSGPRSHGSLVPIDPTTGKPGAPVKVDDAYNMYFTPDGRSAIVVAEAMRRLEFRDPHTMEMQGYVNAPQCPGINHADFSIDSRYAIFTCEFGSALVKIDLEKHELVGTLQLQSGHMPQDIRVAPDGSMFFVADMLADGVILVNGETMKEVGFIPTGVGTHGLYPSRDGRRLYVSNRGTHNLAGTPHGAGSVSVLDFKTREIVDTWVIPNGGSPDMGNVSADGRTLWLSARYDAAVYAINTTDGNVKTIPVGGMPHGLTVWPQPGRYSLGHTGNMR
jgi:DNA-binding beta-propeller fold protein YncE